MKKERGKKRKKETKKIKNMKLRYRLALPVVHM